MRVLLVMYMCILGGLASLTLSHAIYCCGNGTQGIAAIFALSTTVVYVGLKIATPVSTVIAYIFLTFPLIFISIGSVSPGVLTALIVAADSAIDGKAVERRAAQEAGRFLVGYLLGNVVAPTGG